MPLRTPNNGITDGVLLSALATVLLGTPSPNTALALNSTSGTGLEQVAIQDDFALSMGPWPMVLLWAGAQHYARSSRSTWIASMEVTVEYYDRWDQQPNTIAQVRANIAADLERMKANLESNETLTQNAQVYALAMPDLHLSPYKGETITTDVAGLSLIKRSMTCTFHLLDYDT